MSVNFITRNSIRSQDHPTITLDQISLKVAAAFTELFDPITGKPLSDEVARASPRRKSKKTKAQSKKKASTQCKRNLRPVSKQNYEEFSSVKSSKNTMISGRKSQHEEFPEDSKSFTTTTTNKESLKLQNHNQISEASQDHFFPPSSSFDSSLQYNAPRFQPHGQVNCSQNLSQMNFEYDIQIQQELAMRQDQDLELSQLRSQLQTCNLWLQTTIVRIQQIEDSKKKRQHKLNLKHQAMNLRIATQQELEADAKNIDIDEDSLRIDLSPQSTPSFKANLQDEEVKIEFPNQSSSSMLYQD